MTARVLVVDDIPANVKLLEARLMAEYFDVVTAEDGFKALAICDEEQVDIILLDIMMPGMDGFEVCERLKANPNTAHIPVVMVTALDQPSDRVRGLKAGADDFLTKPVNDLQLIARVKSLVRLKAVSDEPAAARRDRTADRHRGDAAQRWPDADARPRIGGGRPRQARRNVSSGRSSRLQRSMLSRSRRRRCSRRRAIPSNSSSSIPISRTTIRCGCARSFARWNAPVSCRCFWWRSRGG